MGTVTHRNPSILCISSLLLCRYNGILLYGLDNVAAGFSKATKIPETLPKVGRALVMFLAFVGMKR